MNYLAHAFLSNNKDHLLIGNFIADHLRGNDFSSYGTNIAEGILLHRRIDAFTDAHPKFRESKRLFYNGFERYSGVLVDIYFDHLLARNFSKYSPTPLDQFAEHVYGIYMASQPLLPKSSAGFLDYVIKNNIYSAYARLQGIEQVLTHLSHRIGHAVQLQDSVKLFREAETQLQANFDVFFTDAFHEFTGL